MPRPTAADILRQFDYATRRANTTEERRARARDRQELIRQLRQVGIR